LFDLKNGIPSTRSTREAMYGSELPYAQLDRDQAEAAGLTSKTRHLAGYCQNLPRRRELAKGRAWLIRGN